MKLEVIAEPGQAPEAVFAHPSGLDSGRSWIFAAKLLGSRAVLDLELSLRWNRFVACTPEFSRWWRYRRDMPFVSFELEVLA